jgi:diguanylate cyclase (GGDEF)-like protein/putative nucleotidyltransferase with HDIG domain
MRGNPDAVGGQRKALRVSVAEFFATPLTQDASERRLSGRVGGMLWIGGGFVVLAPALVHRAGTGNLPLGVTIVVSLIAMVWGWMSLQVLDWVNGPAWLGHLTAAGGLVTLAAVVYLTGEARSVGWQYFTWLALFGCFFFRRPAAIGFMIACLVAQALPLAFHPGTSLNEGSIWRLALVVFGYASVGAAVIRGKQLTVDLRRRAERAADIDPVTGVANHRRMDRALSEHAARSLDTGVPFALAVLDVDHLTHIKELHGQDAVEQALRGLAGAISRRAAAHDVIARTGSDEFSWLMPGLTATQAQARVESARLLLDASGPEPVQFSAGVVDSFIEADPSALTRLAGGALYWSKVDGRAQSRIYDAEVMDVLSADERAERLRRSQALIGLLALARAIDAKDAATREHSERVANLAEALARIVGWEDARALALRDAALVHDVGKIGIDDAILRKATALTPAEREHINSHAEISARIVDGVLGPEQVAWIRTHHERIDGSGYPDGLGGAEIPLGGALLAIADAFDAMTAGRRYSARRDPADALAECRAQIGRHFSHEAVAALEVWLMSAAAATEGLPADDAAARTAGESLVSGHGPGRDY